MPLAPCVASHPAACPNDLFVTYPVPLCRAHAVDVALQVTDRLFATALQPSYSDTLFGGDQALIEASALASEDVWDVTTHLPVVYFMTNGDRIKIGTSRNIRARVTALSLRRSNTSLLLRGDHNLERALHHAFAAHRLGSSEWFVAHPDIQRFISAKSATEPDETPWTPAPKPVPLPAQRNPTADEKVVGALRRFTATGWETFYATKDQIAAISGVKANTLNNALSRLTKAGQIHRQVDERGDIVRGVYALGPAPAGSPADEDADTTSD